MPSGFKLLLTLAIASWSATASAGAVTVEGKVFNPTPSYFSILKSEFRISYEPDAHFEPGKDRLFLRYGYTADWGSDKSVWHKEQTVELWPVALGKWQVVLSDEVAGRGSYRYSDLNFVFVVQDPSGREKYVDNGTEGKKWSFYRVHFPSGLLNVPLRDYEIVVLD